MNSAISDIDLWEQTRGGDKQAFEQLFKSYHRFLFHYGQKHTGDHELLEDCIQELFIDLWEKAPVTALQSFRGYLFQSFRFKLYRQLHKNDQLNKARSQLPDESCFTLSHEHFIVNREVSSEISQQVQNAILKLSKRQQEIIYLRFYLEMEYEEICHVMQINYQVSRNLICQAIKALKTDLGSVPLLYVTWLLCHQS